MNTFLNLVILTSCVWMTLAAQPTSKQLPSIQTTLRQRPLPCRPALRACLRQLDNGEQCEILPVPPRSLLTPVPQGSFLLEPLRTGVWSYNDGVYLSLILLTGKRLALIDFPDSAGSNTNTGSGTRLTDAVEQIIGDTIPDRIDMMYSHAHFDHIGGSVRFYNYARNLYPDAEIVVWGNQESKELIQVSTTNRARTPDVIVGEGGEKLTLGPDLSIEMMIVGGHSQQDLALFIPRSNGEGGIVHYVDTVVPRWSLPFNLGMTQDVREMIEGLRTVLKLRFDIFSGGHLQNGGRREVVNQLLYMESLIAVARRTINSATPEDLAARGIGRTQDPTAREFGNAFFILDILRGTEVDNCFKLMIAKWGCRLASLDLFLRSHCLLAINFISTDL